MLSICISSGFDYYNPTKVPAAADGMVPKDWSLKSHSKTVKRYWTSFVEVRQKPLAEAKVRPLLQ